MKLPILHQNYLDELRRNLESGASLPKYRQLQSENFPIKEDGLVRNTSIEVPTSTPVLSVSTPGSSAEDAENARLIFAYLSKLERWEASDPRIWTYLTHATFSEYAIKRWPLRTPRRSAIRDVQSHWFVAGGKGGLRRNAIARLWWAAFLTYAPWKKGQTFSRFETDNEFRYTEILMSNQDIYQGLIERDFGSDFRTRIALLFVIGELAEEVPNVSKFVNELFKLVNLSLASRSFSLLPVDDLVIELGRLAELAQNKVSGPIVVSNR